MRDAAKQFNDEKRKLTGSNEVIQVEVIAMDGLTALGWRIVAHHASPGTPREAQEILESAAVLH